jgi:hypothetical protein
MSIRQEDGVIVLEGRCTAEDAETLLVALQDRPECHIDASGLIRAHLAVVQVLRAMRPVIQALPANPVLADIIMDQS